MIIRSLNRKGDRLPGYNLGGSNLILWSTQNSLIGYRKNFCCTLHFSYFSLLLEWDLEPCACYPRDLLKTSLPLYCHTFSLFIHLFIYIYMYFHRFICCILILPSSPPPLNTPRTTVSFPSQIPILILHHLVFNTLDSISAALTCIWKWYLPMATVPRKVTHSEVRFQ